MGKILSLGTPSLQAPGSRDQQKEKKKKRVIILARLLTISSGEGEAAVK